MRTASFVALSTLGFLAASFPLAGCSSSDEGERGREEGQTEFQSAPPIGQGGGALGSRDSAESAGGATNAPTAPKDGMQNERRTQETDIYRIDGDRLYFLNGYRGLLVFDISNVDDPKLLGRSPISGTPVEMFVEGGIATVVVGDWYGNAADGSPFHGSVVRTIDARNPTQIKVNGEVQLKGWARDMRVVGKNLYVVSEDYGWYYGMWGGGYGGVVSDAAYGPGGGSSKVVVSSVNFESGAPSLRGSKEYDGYSGAFHVTSNAIIMARDVLVDAGNGGKKPTGKAALEYLDISDSSGAIVPRSTIEVDGLLNGWSADNGRWNIDLLGDKASVLTCAGMEYGYCNGQQGYNLTTIDYANPAAPQKLATLPIASKGWAATARFNLGRMYLSPRDDYGQNGNQGTPLEIYDVSQPATPTLAGSTTIDGAVWLFVPSGLDRLFVLGNEYGNGYSSSQVALRYVDVADPTQPKLLGTSKFGEGWAWTPAAGTFKAFTRDAEKKLVALPFSGWSNQTYEYRNGVQLIEYDTNTITTKGAARAEGWVERGVFAKDRLLSISDQSLTVVDYADRANPKVLKEVTLARNVVSAKPAGGTIAQLSTDWWGYDNKKSELRVLPIGDAEELANTAALASVKIDGTDARVFRNGDLAYVVTSVESGDKSSGYVSRTPRIQVVDLANGGATLRGSISLPPEQNYYWSWWGGCYYYDWYEGSSALQVGSDVLTFRRTRGSYDPNTGKYTTEQKLFVVDLANADGPKLSAVEVLPDADAWWGNMRVVGNTLYTTHYEWIEKPSANPDPNANKQYWIRYYLDQVDLSDRANPKVGARINVPGILVGASETDPSLLYFVDYRWTSSTNQPKDELAVAKIQNGKAYLKSSTLLDGWVGQVLVRGNKAYASAQTYGDQNNTSKVQLHEIDLTDPAHPIDRPSAAKDGWGWLVDVEGDRAIITSGWGQVGLDIYRLTPNAPPTFEQFARTRGWWPNAIERQGNDLFVSTGYWGVQKIGLGQ